MKQIEAGLFAQAVQKLAKYNSGEADNWNVAAHEEDGGHSMPIEYDKRAAEGHIYHDIVALRQAFPVTIHKLMGDDDLCKHLTNLITYNASEESESFDEMFDTDDSSDLPTDEVLAFTTGNQRIPGIINAFDHIYQVIRYVESEIEAAVLRRSVFELGDAIEGRNPQQTTNLWLGIKKTM